MKRLIYILLLLLTMPGPASAKVIPVPDDIGVVEAYIAEHKSQRTDLWARAITEQANGVAHNAALDASTAFQKVNDLMDKYTIGFDALDLIYAGLRTGIKGKEVADSIISIVGSYKRLYTAYYNEVVKRGLWEPSDTMIVVIARDAIVDVVDKTKDLVYSAECLGLMLVAKNVPIKMSTLTMILESITEQMVDIKDTLVRTYYLSCHVINSRRGFYRDYSVYKATPKSVTVRNALDRWRQNSLEAFHRHPITATE